MQRTILVSIILVVLALSPVTLQADDSTDKKAVLDAVQALLDAINGQDAAAVHALGIDEAVLISLRHDPEGNPKIGFRKESETSFPEEDRNMVERIWSPVVMVKGNIAAVWAPFDFYMDGKFSHCGINAFHLLKVGGTWKLSATTYTAVTDGTCETHPDGPPR
jgi:ketosteroid isomerase-like protein